MQGRLNHGKKKLYVGQRHRQRRTFAPLYRQVTLTALRANLGGGASTAAPDREMGYQDIINAWNYYLENHTQGRAGRRNIQAHAGVSVRGSNRGIVSYVSFKDNILPPANCLSGRNTESSTAMTTPFVSVPGLLSGECVNNGQFSYLQVTVYAGSADPRTDTISGDVVNADGTVNAVWGQLHQVNVNVAMGDLVTLAGRQARAYLAR